MISPRLPGCFLVQASVRHQIATSRARKPAGRRLRAGTCGAQRKNLRPVDDYLFRACQALGQPAAARWRDAAAACYTRLGATWWHSQLGLAPAGLRITVAGTPAVLHFHPGPGSGWTVGPAGATVTVPAARGLAYLRYLLQCPRTDVPAADLAAAATAVPAPGGPAGRAREHGLAVAGSSPGELADA